MKVAPKQEGAKGRKAAFHLTNQDVKAIQEGIKSLKEGRVTPWEDVKAELRQKPVVHLD